MGVGGWVGLGSIDGGMGVQVRVGEQRGVEVGCRTDGSGGCWMKSLACVV